MEVGAHIQKSENYSWKFVLSYHQVGYTGQTQVFKLADKNLYALCQLPALTFFLVKSCDKFISKSLDTDQHNFKIVNKILFYCIS